MRCRIMRIGRFQFNLPRGVSLHKPVWPATLEWLCSARGLHYLMVKGEALCAYQREMPEAAIWVCSGPCTM